MYICDNYISFSETFIACHINCVLIVIYILPVKYIKIINLIQNTKEKYTLLLYIEITF